MVRRRAEGKRKPVEINLYLGSRICTTETPEMGDGR